MLSPTALSLVVSTAAVGMVAAYCDIPAQPQWASTPDAPLAQPMHNWTSLKDFTHVPYKGLHLVYGSIVNDEAYSSMNFGVFDDWSDMKTVGQNGMVNATVAPTLFYFAPKSTWVLCYQWGPYPFSYRLSEDPADANGWGPEMPLYQGGAPGAPYGPIDQTVIADADNMYLFFAGDNGAIYRDVMPIGDFPSSFGTMNATQILNDTAFDLYEAVQVYKLQGQKKYLMMVECVGAVGRYFRSFTATHLGGTFTELSGLESNPFAGKSNTAITWSVDISHGDLIRSTHDQTFEIDPCNLQFLYQGRNASNPNYNDLPYRPGLLTLQNPCPPGAGCGSNSSSSVPSTGGYSSTSPTAYTSATPTGYSSTTPPSYSSTSLTGYTSATPPSYSYA